MFRRFAIGLILLATPAAAQDRVVTEADGSRTLVSEAVIPVAPDTLWHAVTTAEGWKRWAARSAWIAPGEPDMIETSYDSAARPGDPDNIRQRVVARLPGRMLVFRTVKAPAGFPHAQDYMHVTNFLELIPEGEGTRVRLTAVDYPAGAAGDQLIDFFKRGNRATLDNMAATLSLAPLDFLTGHCWKGTLPNGDVDAHCFKALGNEVRDHHAVTRAGKIVYAGDSSYAFADGAVRWVYRDATGGEMKGGVRGAPDGLDFGTAEYVDKDGGKIVIATHWVRIGDDAYEVRDRSSLAAHNRTTRYVKAD